MIAALSLLGLGLAALAISMPAHGRVLSVRPVASTASRRLRWTGFSVAALGFIYGVAKAGWTVGLTMAAGFATLVVLALAMFFAFKGRR